MKEKAEEKIEYILKLDQSNKDARYLKARILLVDKDKQGSLDILQQLILENYRNRYVYQLIASIYLEDKQFDIAEKILNEGIDVNKDAIELKALLVNVYDMQKRTEDAIDLIKTLIEMEPDKEMHKIAFARLLWKIDRKDETQQYLDTILANDPANIHLWKTVISFYYSLREAAMGEKVLRKGIAVNDKNFELRFFLQQALFQQGKLDEALHVLQECLELDNNPASPDIITTRIKIADIYFLQGAIDEAEQQVLFALKENPKSIEGHYLKGRIDLLAGRFDDAVTEFRQVVSERPDFVDAYLRLAEVLVRNKQQDVAIATLQTAAKANPDHGQLPLVLSRLYKMKGDLVSAEKVLRDIIGVHPDNQRLKVELGNFYVEQARYSEAEAIFAEVMEQAPDIAAGYVSLGYLYARQGGNEKAAATILRGYQANPDSPLLLEELVKRYLALNRNDDAVKACQERIREKPEDVVAYNLLGRVHMVRKEFARAEEAFAKAVSLQPQWQDPHNNLATLALVQGKVDAAIEKLTAGIAADPKNGSAYLTLAALYEKSGDLAKAMQVYEQALTALPTNWVAANNLSFLLSEQAADEETLKRALKLAKMALKMKPESASVLDTVGWVYLKLGDYEKAEGFAARALAQNPEHPVMNYHLGVILHQMGKRDEARERLRKAVEGGGDSDAPWRTNALELLNLPS